MTILREEGLGSVETAEVNPSPSARRRFMIRMLLGVCLAMAVPVGTSACAGVTANPKPATQKATAQKPIARKAVAKKPSAKKPATKTTTSQTNIAGTSAPKATTAATTAAQVPTCTVRFMPLGDSLTGFPEGYRGPLYRGLTGAGVAVDFVGSAKWEPIGGGDPDSEGWGGYRIGPDDGKDHEGRPANLDFHLEKWLADAKPHVILLSIGANDLAAGGAIAAAAPQKFSALVAKIRRLAPNAKLLIADIPPGAMSINGNELVDNFNRTVKATGNGRDIVHINTFRALVDAGFDPNVDTTDGQHFSESGGRKYANVLLPEVRKAIETVRC